jgi:hypothetical protein
VEHLGDHMGTKSRSDELCEPGRRWTHWFRLLGDRLWTRFR